MSNHFFLTVLFFSLVFVFKKNKNKTELVTSDNSFLLDTTKFGTGPEAFKLSIRVKEIGKKAPKTRVIWTQTKQVRAAAFGNKDAKKAYFQMFPHATDTEGFTYQFCDDLDEFNEMKTLFEKYEIKEINQRPENVVDTFLITAKNAVNEAINDDNEVDSIIEDTLIDIETAIGNIEDKIESLRGNEVVAAGVLKGAAHLNCCKNNNKFADQCLQYGEKLQNHCKIDLTNNLQVDKILLALQYIGAKRDSNGEETDELVMARKEIADIQHRMDHQQVF